MNLDNLDLAKLTEEAGTLVISYAFSVAGALLLIIVGFFVASMVRRWTYNSLARFNKRDTTLNHFLSSLARYGILIIFGIMVLGQFGVQTASILAALGAAGLAIGLALQGTLQNIAAGVMLLFLRPFRVGDFVEAGGISGSIVEIGLFATEMKTIDGRYLFAPNSELWNVPVVNFNRLDTRRNDLEIGIGYEDDIEAAQEILQQLANEETRVLDTPEPVTFVSSLGDNAVSVNLRYWTKTPDWFATGNELRKRAKIAMDNAGISIPFPQSDVHIISAPSSSAVQKKGQAK